MKKALFLVLAIIASFYSRAQTIPAYVPSAGLLAWYPFTGNPNDSSSFGNNGVEYGGVTYGTDRFGKAGSCFVADGASAIDFPVNNFPIGNAARTVSVFFKLSYPIATGQRELFAWGNNAFVGGRFGLELTSDTAIGWESVGGAVFSSFVADTFWHNLTVVYPTGGTGTYSIKLYVDGELANITSVYSPISILNTDTTPIHDAGSLSLSYLYGWVGSLDDIGIWDRELTSCEIETMYYGPQSIMPKITKTGKGFATDTTYSGYQWIRNGVVIFGATTDSFTSTSIGTYKVAVTTPGGCADTSLAFAYGTTEVINTFSADDIKIYPNPAASVVSIQCPIKVSVTLSGIEGNIILRKEEATEIDISDVPNGIYLLSLFDGDGNKIKTARISKLSQ